jgi:hypothetical protein
MGKIIKKEGRPLKKTIYRNRESFLYFFYRRASRQPQAAHRGRHGFEDFHDLMFLQYFTLPDLYFLFKVQVLSL